MTPKVYAIQNQHFRDRVTGQLFPKLDIGPAEQYGEVEFIFEPNARAHVDTDKLVEQAWDVLSRMRGCDFLLVMGDPVLIGIAYAVASHVLHDTGHNVNALKWSKRLQAYEVVSANPFFGSDDEQENDE